MKLRQRTFSAAAVLALGALALSACQSSGHGTSADPGAGAASASATGVAQASESAVGTPVSAASPSHASAAPNPAKSGKAPGGSTPTQPAATGGGSDADSDSYAWRHFCTAGQLSITFTAVPGGSASERLISVRNNGAKSCGLDYYPHIAIGRSASADGTKDVHPLVPGGLGGAPSSPVYAGQTVYAVLDLDPSGSGSTVPGLNEVSVLADEESIPNAEVRDFPLAAGTAVSGKPKLGLFERTVADATSSMRTAAYPAS